MFPVGFARTIGQTLYYHRPGPCFNIKTIFSGMGIPIYNENFYICTTSYLHLQNLLLAIAQDAIYPQYENFHCEGSWLTFAFQIPVLVTEDPHHLCWIFWEMYYICIFSRQKWCWYLKSFTSYTAGIRAADILVTQGARASAAMDNGLSCPEYSGPFLVWLDISLESTTTRDSFMSTITSPIKLGSVWQLKLYP